MGHPPPGASPPAFIVSYALSLAGRSPCAKSKRGVVAYADAPPPSRPAILGSGFNGPPPGFRCGGDDACRAGCGKLCVHAELRALWSAWGTLSDVGGFRSREVHLVHVKATDGRLAAGGGPSCWQCSRQILEAGAAGIWLYEAQPEEACPQYDALRVECPYCQGEACRECEIAAATANPRPSCDHDVLDRHYDLPLVPARWRYYDAQAFHAATLAACELPANRIADAR